MIYTSKVGNTEITLDSETLAISVHSGSAVWHSDAGHQLRVITANDEILFKSAMTKQHEAWSSGLGNGIRSRYAAIPGLGGLEFETLIWIETSTNNVIFEWIPIREAVNVSIKSVCFPAPFELTGKQSYSSIPFLQGVLLPNDWQKELPPLPFGGQFCCSAATMPWWGQTRDDSGYIAIVEQPWDAMYTVSHNPDTGGRLSVGWLPTLGRMGYRRALRVIFPGRYDYVGLCKTYRGYAKENGLLVSLEEKAARVPGVNRLIGSAVAHMGIKTNVSPDSRYYNKEEPEKNQSLVTFAERAEHMRQIAAMGINKAYLHLDGWGQPGYDNQHPDYLPACAEAGGWEGLAALSRTCGELGFLFGIHDQYRDYYLDAATYNPNNAVHLADGTIHQHTIWAGGTQNYLCPSLHPMYVKRNFEELLSNGVHLDATYLDVYTCNEPDECTQPMHVVTRKECLEYRRKCFDYLLSRGILSSSEEVVDWAIPSLVFCHWAPYPKAEAGIPVPLLNLVYHDCVIIPWKLGKGEWGTPDGQLGFLHGLLNGGIGYIEPDSDNEEIARVKVINELHEKIAKMEMTNHEFLSEDRMCQRVTFADGTTVTVDFEKETYEIGAK